MDESTAHHILLFVLSLSMLSSCIQSRQIATQTTSKTTTLDVAASLSKAKAAVDYDPKTLVEEHLPFVPASLDNHITLRLQSRDFLSTIQARYQTYQGLTRSRLARDAARVHHITKRVNNALNRASLRRTKLKDGKTVGKSFLDSATIRGPVVSGTSLGSGEYFSRIGVGSPAMEMFVVLDTGSDVNWIQCEPCNECYSQTDAVFDPSGSMSYNSLPCNSQKCRQLDISACRNSSLDVTNCLYQVSYGDGSFTVGDFATETLTLGGSSPVSNVAIGCGHDNEGLFVGAAGLLALGGGPLSFPSQINAKSFSYCLVDRDSPASSTLDVGTSASVGDGSPTPAVNAPLVRNPRIDTYRYVEMTGISVGGEMLAIPPSTFAVGEDGTGGVIVDSGTAVTRLNAAAYAALRDAFREGTAGLPAANSVLLFDTCYDLSSRTSVDVPTVALHFPSGNELRLPAKNYLIPVDSAGTYCLAFASTSSPLSIIGNVQQQGTRVSFDLQDNMVGFTPSSC